jgi:5-methylcytosine-specific restriction endonuclease McrA
MIRRTGYPLNSSRLLKNCGQAKAYAMATLAPKFHRYTGTASISSGVYIELSTTCFYCGDLVEVPTREHQMPRSRGGADSGENIVTACKSCNFRKGSMTAEEFLASRISRKEGSNDE